MKIKNKNYLLIGIFLFTLAFRLYFSLQTNYFSSDDAYFNIRHTNYIIENFKPIYYDELSYGGRYVLYPPLFHYFLAIFILIPFALKIIPEILLASLVFFVYLIAKEITKDENAALFSALISAFIPLYISETLNQVSIYSIVLPLLFYMFYCLIKLDKKIHVNNFIIASFILPLLSPIAFLFVFSIIFYFILTKTEDIELSKLKKELILFSSILILLISFIIYKKAFLEYGLNLIWQNIPFSLLSEHFRGIGVLELIYIVGIIPLFLGSIAIFYGIFREKSIAILLLGSFMLMGLLLAINGLIDFNTGLMFFGITASIIAALPVHRFFSYLKLTKIYKYKQIFIVAGLLLVFILSVIPSYDVSKRLINNVPSNEDIKTLEMLRDFKDLVVLGNVYEGNMITTIAGKKNVIDNLFLLAPKPEQRLEDVNLVYTTNFGTVASEILQRYKVGYILLSKKTKELYNITDLKYANEICFKKFGEGYQVIC